MRADIELKKKELRAELRTSWYSDDKVFTEFLRDEGPFDDEDEEALQGVVDEER